MELASGAGATEELGSPYNRIASAVHGMILSLQAARAIKRRRIDQRRPRCDNHPMMKMLLSLSILAAPAFADIGACPITADFVTQPETIQSTQQMGQLAVNSTTRRAFVDGAMVQIECTGIAPEQVFPGQDDATILTN
jgi:hypothetical protein